MRKVTAVCLLLALPSLSALAAKPDWLLLNQSGDERVALDVGRIGRFADGKVGAWSRLHLAFDIPDPLSGVRYDTIEAFNSYDCKRREYSTLRRIYRNDKGKIVREETVSEPHNMRIGEDSFEEKLFPEVCRRRAHAPLINEPKPVAQAPAAAQSKVQQVADTPSNGIPKGKPHLIDLPKIDPSKVDNPRPAETSEPDQASKDKTSKDKAPSKSTLDAAKLKALIEQSSKAAQASGQDKSVDAPNYYTGDVSRAEIERQLATFGPRRYRPHVARKKRGVASKKSVSAYIPWSYTGKGGPDNWAKLSPDNSLCASGKRQSPIDIRDGIPVDLEPIRFNYGKTAYTEIDTGHTIQVNVAAGQTIHILGKVWQLISFHFHRPAEEQVDGHSYPMDVHLVSKDADGNIAVIAVLLEPGTENPLIQAIWNNLPLERGMVISPSAPIDLSQLLPAKRDYWTYMGSLTTPPCTEEVLWMVMKQPVQASPEQLDIFGRLYPDNARPIQPSNNRLIKESR